MSASFRGTPIGLTPLVGWATCSSRCFPFCSASMRGGLTRRTRAKAASHQLILMPRRCTHITGMKLRATDKGQAGPMAASFSPEAYRVLVVLVIYRDFKDQTLRNGGIVSKRERWDEEWREVGRSHGWKLPPAAPWPLRLWGIRYVRAPVASARLIQQNQLWLSLGCFPSSYDDWVIYAIVRGWC